MLGIGTRSTFSAHDSELNLIAHTAPNCPEPPHSTYSRPASDTLQGGGLVMQPPPEVRTGAKRSVAGARRRRRPCSPL